MSQGAGPIRGESVVVIEVVLYVLTGFPRYLVAMDDKLANIRDHFRLLSGDEDHEQIDDNTRYILRQIPHLCHKLPRLVMVIAKGVLSVNFSGSHTVNHQRTVYKIIKASTLFLVSVTRRNNCNTSVLNANIQKAVRLDEDDPGTLVEELEERIRCLSLADDGEISGMAAVYAGPPRFHQGEVGFSFHTPRGKDGKDRDVQVSIESLSA